MIAASISGGVHRTTDGGVSWTRTTSDQEVFSATTVVQDPRPGFQNIWYYGSGEFFGNSASLSGAFYYGNGIWQSDDGGQNWTKIPSTDSEFTQFDSDFDIIHEIDVHPVTGELFAATTTGILRFNGTEWINELPTSGPEWTSLTITSTGRVYAAIGGDAPNAEQGVWTSEDGQLDFVRIATDGDPLEWGATGRIVLDHAPSSENLVYALFVNGISEGIEADLWRYDLNTDVWTDFTSTMPDEAGGDLRGNDPFAVQGGYDLVVSVKPDDPNFVIIGGTNAYKIGDIETEAQFVRIGGYNSNSNYALWDTTDGDEHHPDIHSIVFSPFNNLVVYTGTDGGVHRTDAIDSAGRIDWVNLNNNFRSYQYYHVAIEPNVQPDRDIVIGGAQDNGTTAGGFATSPDMESLSSVFGGDGVAVSISDDDDCLPFFLGSQGGQIVRDCPVGADITPDESASQFVTYWFLDPVNTNALYYAGRNRLFRTTSSTTVASDTWDNMSTIGNIPGESPNTEFIQSMTTPWINYDPATSYLLIGGDEGGIYRLDDPQNANNLVSATDITPPGVTRTFPSIVSGLAVHPTNPDIAIASYSNYGIPSIFITTNVRDAEPTWVQVERNLEINSVRSVAITENNGETLYFAGTARGLYSSPDPMTQDWSIEAVDEVGFALISDLKYRPEDSKLLIGTHGSGMFETKIEGTLSSPDFEQSTTAFVISPNPTTEVLTLNLDPVLSINAINYQIVDVSGKVIDSGALEGSQRSINVAKLAQGLYFIEVELDGRKEAKRFIKK
ncbi:T9SS type A sorting domain-containing protein [Croceiramulus getboli]|nr:T9SS type A sorting domain-containing protein [Flavobacteriaceae bacterium YJPT1-3]